MKNNTLAAIGVICGLLAVAAIVAGITVGSMHSRDADERERIACVEAGGTYVDSYGPICFGVVE
ncbi:hypothetical protein [Brevibacterium sp. CFH 10365]|uniref:hypothetical protein n=1 Tax=Brevibacterium sp. CFH 10365 TaxID=2585207 RepID=UPI00126625DF|nr:hypothetical protein [Brevibacterium sp. CFH 10365]